MIGLSQSRVSSPADTSPLRIWRTHAPADIVDGVLDEVRKTLLSCGVLVLDRRWPGAIGSDAAAAVGIVIDRFHDTSDPEAPVADLAMSALLLHAFRGNPAAALAMSYGLFRLARSRNSDDRPRALALAWARCGGWTVGRSPRRDRRP